jgi:ABC-type multidrug transport system fused ATPase/permease subunit
VGVVSQDPCLFSGTIRENITVGLPFATQEMVECAAKQANAHSFISQFPDGYDTMISGQNSQLSGGQKQRIAIARCLIRDPKVILLDEATSALDSQSEKIVQEALDDIVKNGNRTTLVVAHRLSTIKDADMIVVIKDGMCIEKGTHTSLLSLRGVYYDLVEAQTTNPKSREADVDVLKTLYPKTRTSELSTTLGAIEEVTSHETIEEVTSHETLVEFKHVGFSYPSRHDQPIFKDLNLSIRKGETIALVGPSGQG